MVKREKKRVLRSPAILVVVFAVLLAMTGLVYTHWSTTARVNGQIDTGGISISYWDHFTNDDGQINTIFDEFGAPFPWDPGDGDETAPNVLDMNVGYSSSDPSSVFWDGFFERYDKDVAWCHVGVEGDEFGDILNINVGNAYPSYYCTTYAQVVNHGSVPIKAELGSVVGAQEIIHECDGEWYTARTELGEGEYTYDPLDNITAVYGGTISDDGGGQFLDLNGNGVFEPGDGTEGSGDARIVCCDDNGDEYLDWNDNGVFDGEDTVIYAGCTNVTTELALVPGVEGWVDAFRPDPGGEPTGDPVLNVGFDEVLCGFQLDPGYGFCDGNWYLERDPYANEITGFYGGSIGDDGGGPFLDLGDDGNFDPGDGTEGNGDARITCCDGNGDEYLDWNDNGEFDGEDTVVYAGCEEVEPNHFPMEVRMHVKQPAEQYASYRFQVEQTFRNWNEFNEAELCPDL